MSSDVGFPDQPTDGVFLLVAGIDFGTTFSAYAFSLKNNQNEIRLNKNWGAAIGCESYKAPTCVLTKPNGDFYKFGFEAEHEYSQLTSSDTSQNDGYQIYRNFKMLLHNEGIKLTSKVTAASGKQRLAIEIFAMALRYLKDHLLNAIRRNMTSLPDVGLIRWVLTVPAVWCDESKAFMREAALRAGLISSFDSKKLSIVLEPEAASAFCRLLDQDQFLHGPDHRELEEFFKPGQKFVIMDAGGGTVDITAQEILDYGKVKEILPPTGGPWGGITVDFNFMNLLNEIFTEDFMIKFQQDHPNDWLGLLTNFEKIKKCVDMVTLKNVRIPISWSMGSACARYLKCNIDVYIKTKKNLGVTFDNGSIILAEHRTKALYEPSINNIVSHLKNLFLNEKLKELDYLLLVGGYSECKLLQDAILKSFQYRTKILIPHATQLVIIKGAVLSGYSTSLVSSRIARHTYGCASMPHFDPNKHTEDKMVIIDGKKLCKDVFHAFVRKGENVEMGRPKIFGFRPPERKATWADFQLYRTDNEAVKYIDDPGIQHIGKISLHGEGKALGNYLEIRITFGDTELLVEAKDDERGERYAVSTTLDFEAE